MTLAIVPSLNKILANIISQPPYADLNGKSVIELLQGSVSLWNEV